MSKEKIQELRKLIPIPINEAGTLLQSTNWNVKEASRLFRKNRLKELRELSGLEIGQIEPLYDYHELDFNKTLSGLKNMIKDSEFDLSQLIGISQSTFENLQKWRTIESHEDLATALLTAEFEVVHRLLANQLDLADLAQALISAKEEYLNIDFQGNIEQDTDLFNAFKSGKTYSTALDLWGNSQIKFSERLAILHRNFVKNENTESR